MSNRDATSALAAANGLEAWAASFRRPDLHLLGMSPTAVLQVRHNLKAATERLDKELIGLQMTAPEAP